MGGPGRLQFSRMPRLRQTFWSPLRGTLPNGSSLRRQMRAPFEFHMLGRAPGRCAERLITDGRGPCAGGCGIVGAKPVGELAGEEIVSGSCLLTLEPCAG